MYNGISQIADILLVSRKSDKTFFHKFSPFLNPPFPQMVDFFIHRKLRPMNEKALRAGCASRGVEVSCKQHRQGAKESQAQEYFEMYETRENS